MLKIKKFWGVAIAFVVLLSGVGVFIPTADGAASAAEEGVSPAKSDNIHDETYMWGSLDLRKENWAFTVKSYLYEGDGGAVNRVELIDGEIVVETYEEGFQLGSSLSLPLELPIFGGFFAAEKYNYLIFGESNSEGSNTAEVVRIVQYSKNWERIGSASLYGKNTSEPFEAGSLRTCEEGDMLYIHTCHQMYSGHQANMTICYRQDTGEITDSKTSTSNLSTGYVSHSFNQFIQDDGESVYTADHGDTYPRSFVLMRYENEAGSESLGKPTAVDLLTFPTFPDDESGNFTGASLGGLEVSDETCLVAYNSMDMYYADWNYYLFQCRRNVFLAVVEKENFSESGLTTRQITNFDPRGEECASNPGLVSLQDGTYILLWEVYDADELMTVNGAVGTHTIQYVRVDKYGNTLGDVHTAEGDLSDCQPILMDGKVLWYVTSDSEPVFYSLDADTEILSSVSLVPEPTPTPTASVGAQKDNQPAVSSTPRPTATKKPSSSSSKYSSTGFYSYAGSTSSTSSLKKPKRVKLEKVKALGKRKARVTWRWFSDQSGFQVQYAKNSTFSKGKKTRKYGTYKSSVKIKRLKKARTYYFRVRAYKKGGGKIKYGKWSRIKKCKVI